MLQNRLILYLNMFLSFSNVISVYSLNTCTSCALSCKADSVGYLVKTVHVKVWSILDGISVFIVNVLNAEVMGRDQGLDLANGHIIMVKQLGQGISETARLLGC